MVCHFSLVIVAVRYVFAICWARRAIKHSRLQSTYKYTSDSGGEKSIAAIYPYLVKLYTRPYVVLAAYVEAAVANASM